MKLHEIFRLKEHPRICEGRLPVKLWLCAPDGKRLESTLDWPAFKAGIYPKLKPALQKKDQRRHGYERLSLILGQSLRYNRRDGVKL